MQIRVAIPAADPPGKLHMPFYARPPRASACAVHDRPMTRTISRLRTEWFADAGEARRDILAGIVVSLALIPEAIGFSIISGVDPRVGLYASVAIAIVISLLGGRKLLYRMERPG